MRTPNPFLLALLVLLSWFVLAGPVKADYSAAAVTYYYGNPANGCPTPSGYMTTYTTPLSAAQACAPTTTSVNPSPGFGCAAPVGGYCGVPSNIGVLVNTVYSCPSGGTLSGSTCVNGCTAGAASSGTVSWGATPGAAASACQAGCKALYTGSDTDRRVLVDGAYVYLSTGVLTKTGEGCSAEAVATAPGTDPAATCASGQTMGSINGVQQCFDTGTGDPVNPNSGLQNSTTPTTISAGPGGVGTIEVTILPSGEKQTVTKDASGNVIELKREDGDPLKELCERNPKSALCSKSTFAGSCIAGFVCEGDAAACAAAKGVNELNCKLAVDPAATSAAAVEAAGTTGAKAAYLATASTKDVSTALKYSDRSIAPQTCPAPMLVETPLGNLSFSWQMFCDLAGIISVFLVMGSTILAVRIFVGGA
jgi:hypothetical protein